MDRVKAKKMLFTINILAFLLGIAASPAIIMSPMMFDAPGSEKILALQLIVYSLFTYPLSVLLGILTSLVFYFIKKFKIAVYCSFLPALNITAFLAGVILLLIFKGDGFFQ